MLILFGCDWPVFGFVGLCDCGIACCCVLCMFFYCCVRLCTCAFVFFHSRNIVFPISLGHWALDTGGLAAPTCCKELIQEIEEFMDTKMDELNDGTNQPKWLDIGEYIENTYSVEEFTSKLRSRTQPFGTQFK